MREPGKRHDIEDKARRSSLHPQPCHILRKNRVVARIHFDGRKMAGVEGQPLSRGCRAWRIEEIRIDQRRIGPRSCANQKLRATSHSGVKRGARSKELTSSE